MAKRTLSFDTKEIENIVEVLEAYYDEHDPRVHLDKLPWFKRLKNALRTIKVSSAKAKGRNLQQDVCRGISEAIGIPYEPGKDGQIMSRSMGASGTDVLLIGDALKKFPYSVECKAVENLNLLDAINQAKENTIDGTTWLVIHDRKKFSEPVAILDWSQFLKIVANSSKKVN